MIVTGILEVEIGTRSGASSSPLSYSIGRSSAKVNVRRTRVMALTTRSYARKMERTTFRLSVLFLLLVVLLEVWVFYMETNRRVRALRLHVLCLQELSVTAAVWYTWKRVKFIFQSSKTLSVNTIAKGVFFVHLGFSQAAIVLGLVYIGPEPLYVTRISQMCLGVTVFIALSILAVELVSYCIRKVLCVKSAENEAISVKTEIRWRTLFALVTAAVLSFAGMLGVAQLAVEKVNIPLSGLNPHLNGTTIVQLSDIHLGPYNGQSALRSIVQSVNTLNPDIVVITGDLVDGAVVYMREIMQLLKDLKSKHGVFFATGEQW